MSNDVFAQIAANGIGGRQWLLEEKTPAEKQIRKCILTDKTTGEYIVPERSSNREQLGAELIALRKQMEPFLANFAPQFQKHTVSTELKTFCLDGNQTVSIPHYEGPIGKACKTYETEFSLNKRNDKSYYVCFRGADYYAVVYVNNTCVGTHEGFFAPFEFEITDVAKNGSNHLKIQLYNDFIYGGNAFAGADQTEGDKLYAATGLGWDDPYEGWHHCPAGMGIFDKVFVEERNPIHLTDLYVRPMENARQQLRFF